jgi:hypothetical protein
MPTPRPSDKRKKLVADVQGMLDNAPGRGKRGTYLRLPDENQLGWKLEFFKPVVDKNYQLIFLPWEAGPNNPAKAEGQVTTQLYLFAHRAIGPDNETYLCPRKTEGKPCPICEDFARRNTAREKWDTIKDLKPRNREVWLVHDINGDLNNVQVWEESTALFGDFLRGALGMHPDYKNFANHDSGYVVSMRGREKRIETSSCAEFATVALHKRERAIPDAILDKAFQLRPEDWRHVPSFDDLERVYYQTGGTRPAVAPEDNGAGGYYSPGQESAGNYYSPGQEEPYDADRDQPPDGGGSSDYQEPDAPPEEEEIEEVPVDDTGDEPPPDEPPPPAKPRQRPPAPQPAPPQTTRSRQTQAPPARPPQQQPQQPPKRPPSRR